MFLTNPVFQVNRIADSLYFAIQTEEGSVNVIHRKYDPELESILGFIAERANESVRGCLPVPQLFSKADIRIRRKTWRVSLSPEGILRVYCAPEHKLRHILRAAAECDFLHISSEYSELTGIWKDGFATVDYSTSPLSERAHLFTRLCNTLEELENKQDLIKEKEDYAEDSD